jgi:hypothetical protein
MIRQRKNKDRLKIIRELDAFPKVKEEYVENTKLGGTCKKKIKKNRVYE